MSRPNMSGFFNSERAKKSHAKLKAPTMLQLEFLSRQERLHKAAATYTISPWGNVRGFIGNSRFLINRDGTTTLAYSADTNLQ